MKQRYAQSRARSAPLGSVRIIAGQWRGSRLEVPLVEGLRPSSDRVRETLFNWLQAEVAGARCLDVFAGSGALGFEAASRGAASVVMIERDRAAIAALQATSKKLSATQVSVVASDALTWLRQPATTSFDLVFVDPPFAANIHQQVMEALIPWLTPRALVYVEAARDHVLPRWPGFEVRREGNTRDVHYELLQHVALHPADETPVTLAPSSGYEPAN